MFEKESLYFCMIYNFTIALTRVHLQFTKCEVIIWTLYIHYILPAFWRMTIKKKESLEQRYRSSQKIQQDMISTRQINFFCNMHIECIITTLLTLCKHKIHTWKHCALLQATALLKYMKCVGNSSSNLIKARSRGANLNRPLFFHL